MDLTTLSTLRSSGSTDLKSPVSWSLHSIRLSLLESLDFFQMKCMNRLTTSRARILFVWDPTYFLKGFLSFMMSHEYRSRPLSRTKMIGLYFSSIKDKHTTRTDSLFLIKCDLTRHEFLMVRIFLSSFVLGITHLINQLTLTGHRLSLQSYSSVPVILPIILT